MDIDLEPAPRDVWDRLDVHLVETGLFAHMSDAEQHAVERGEIRWSLSGFDGNGLATVEMWTVAGEVLGRWGVHWSVIVTPALS